MPDCSHRGAARVRDRGACRIGLGRGAQNGEAATGHGGAEQKTLRISSGGGPVQRRALQGTYDSYSPPEAPGNELCSGPHAVREECTDVFRSSLGLLPTVSQSAIPARSAMPAPPTSAFNPSRRRPQLYARRQDRSARPTGSSFDGGAREGARFGAVRVDRSGPGRSADGARAMSQTDIGKKPELHCVLQIAGVSKVCSVLRTDFSFSLRGLARRATQTISAICFVITYAPPISESPRAHTAAAINPARPFPPSTHKQHHTRVRSALVRGLANKRRLLRAALFYVLLFCLSVAAMLVDWQLGCRHSLWKYALSLSAKCHVAAFSSC
ncbi:uncharacterized protein V1518DRAFT_406588 [Limtongia smithiae]|uniref:uncharacterized protein n=1 Tax=Limtongia smithiae TaxID=1125753 RepID=UPI0034CF2D53